MDLVTTIKVSLFVICITLILLDIFLLTLIKSICKIGSIKVYLRNRKKKGKVEVEPEEGDSDA